MVGARPFSQMQESCTVKGEGVAVKMEMDVERDKERAKMSDSQTTLANRGFRRGPGSGLGPFGSVPCRRWSVSGVACARIGTLWTLRKLRVVVLQ